MFDLCFGIIAYWIFGFGIAYGKQEQVNYLFGTNKEYFVSSGFKDIKGRPDEDIFMTFIFSL